MKNNKEKIEEAIAYAGQGKINVYNWQETIENYTVVVLGLGNFFSDTSNRLFKMCNVAYVTDNDESKWGKFFNGKKCISPQEILTLENPFVIAVVGDFLPIREQMNQMGIPVMHVLEMYFEYYEKGIDTNWLRESKDSIFHVLENFADEESADIFTNVFCNKIYGAESENWYQNFASDGEYFQTGILSLDNHEVIVDAGAYVGDTVDDIVQLKGKEFDKIYTFELNSKNYLSLKQNISKYEDVIRDKIEPIHAGVWSCCDEKWCDHYGDLDGCQVMTEQRGERCQLINLDSIIPKDQKVTVIKMDIEGAEQDALKGAQNLIERYTPKLAICLYHKPEDLWEIPLWIKSLNPSYKIYLRHHSFYNYTDTICYAQIG